MKELKFIILVACVVAVCGCQAIGEKEQLIPVAPEDISCRSNVLLTEFTGFLCVNCPNAAEEAHKLLGIYPENLVVVAMHPASNSFTTTSNAKYDYTCPEADVYYQSLGGTATTSFPTGSLNFNPTFSYYTSWMGDFIRNTIQQPVVQVQFGETISSIPKPSEPISCNTELLITPLVAEPLDVRVLLWVTEDDVLGGQRMPDGTTNLAYRHQHMLRGELLSQDGWGKTLTLRSATKVSSMGTLPLPKTLDTEAEPHFNLVAVVLDQKTNRVLDVKQLKLYKE